MYIRWLLLCCLKQRNLHIPDTRESPAENPQYPYYKYCGDGDDSKYLQVGDLVLTETGFAKVESITRKDFVKPITVYNFLPAEGDAFLAGNIVVAAEDPDVPSTFVERPIFRRQIIG